MKSGRHKWGGRYILTGWIIQRHRVERVTILAVTHLLKEFGEEKIWSTRHVIIKRHLGTSHHIHNNLKSDYTVDCDLLPCWSMPKQSASPTFSVLSASRYVFIFRKSVISYKLQLTQDCSFRPSIALLASAAESPYWHGQSSAYTSRSKNSRKDQFFPSREPALYIV